MFRTIFQFHLHMNRLRVTLFLTEQHFYSVKTERTCVSVRQSRRRAELLAEARRDALTDYWVTLAGGGGGGGDNPRTDGPHPSRSAESCPASGASGDHHGAAVSPRGRLSRRTAGRTRRVIRPACEQRGRRGGDDARELPCFWLFPRGFSLPRGRCASFSPELLHHHHHHHHLMPGAQRRVRGWSVRARLGSCHILLLLFFFFFFLSAQRVWLIYFFFKVFCFGGEETSSGLFGPS